MKVKNKSFDKICRYIKRVDQAIEIRVLHFIDQIEREHQKESEEERSVYKDNIKDKEPPLRELQNQS